MKTTKRPLSEKLHRIKSRFRRTLWLGIALTTIGSCMEYTAYYPISKPKERTIKSKLLGDWQYISAINRNTGKNLDYGGHFMRISPFNEQEYLVQLIGDTLVSIKDIDQFRGFTTTLANQKLANLSPIKNDGKRPVFSIYEYRLKGDSLIFHGISEDTFDTLNVIINSIGQHKKFIKSSLSRPKWWDMEYKYVLKK